MIVVDTNLIAYAVLPGEHTEAALEVARRDAEWVAPRLWRSELRNVMATAMRVAALKLASAAEAFTAAEDLVADLDRDPPTALCLRLAARGGVSAYDAEFVAAAETLGLRLVTLGRRLARAFPGRALLAEEFLAL